MIADRAARGPGVAAKRSIGALLVVLAGLVATLATGPASARPSQDTTASTTTTSVAGTAPTVVDPTAPPGPTTSAPSLVVSAVSPWVEPDGELRVDLRVDGPVPADAVIATSVHQRLRADSDDTLRAAVADAVAGGDLPALMRPPTVVPVAQLGDPAAGVVLVVPVRTTRSSDDDRLLLPNPGIHPVTIELRDATGAVLATTTVFLNRLPTTMPTTRGGRPGQLSLSLQTVVDGPPALDVAGGDTIDDDTRSSLAAAVRLAAASSGAPLTLAVRPNLLDGLSRSDDPTDVETLDLLRRSVVDPSIDVVMARMTYASVDTGGLFQADDGLGELLRQLALGDAAVRSTLSVPTDDSSWVGDDTVTMRSLELLEAMGVHRLVTDADSLQLADTDLDPALLTTRAAAITPSTLTATAPDPDLAALAVAPAGAVLADAAGGGQRANAIVTSLMADWFTADDEGSDAFPGPSSVLSLPAHTDPAVLEALAAALATPGPITLSRDAVPAVAATVDGDELVARLPEQSSSDQDAAVRDVVATRARVDGYRSMAPSASDETDLWERVNAQALDASLDDDARTRYRNEVDGEIAARLARVHLPKERRVVITSRDSTIPLRFRNDLPYPVVLELWFRSVRIGIDGDDRQAVTLPPGETRMDLDVTARAAGGSLLRIDASSPDGELVLPAVAVPVTASTISGVGAALSALSLAFLAIWWGVTIRRERRRRRDRSDDRDASGHDVGDPAIEPASAGSGPVGVGPPGPDETDSVNGGG